MGLTLQLPNMSMPQKELCFCLFQFSHSKTPPESLILNYLGLYLKESGHFLKLIKQFINAISYLNVGYLNVGLPRPQIACEYTVILTVW